MEQKVVFICRTCQHVNKSKLGTEGFEVQSVKFDSFTEAYQHLVGTGGFVTHYIEAVTESEEEY